MGRTKKIETDDALNDIADSLEFFKTANADSVADSVAVSELLKVFADFFCKIPRTAFGELKPMERFRLKQDLYYVANLLDQ